MKGRKRIPEWRDASLLPRRQKIQSTFLMSSPPHPVLILKPWNKDPAVCKDDTGRRRRFNKSDKVCVLRRESSAIPEVLLVSVGPFECVCVAVGRASTHTPALP